MIRIIKESLFLNILYSTTYIINLGGLEQPELLVHGLHIIYWLGGGGWGVRGVGVGEWDGVGVGHTAVMCS